MKKITFTELTDCLQEILDCDAFELHADFPARVCSENTTQDFYIPYMMNDALECYLLLKNSRMTGNYLPDYKGHTTVELISSNTIVDTALESEHYNSAAVIFRQGTDNVFTIWFEEAFRVRNCYRYDQIGHFWVKSEEHWRRLVYIIGTIYDKYEYMGEQVCNEKETALLPLMEFAPFRMYSPIHESLDTYYSESEEGLKCITALAKEASDRSYLRLLRFYHVLPFLFMRKILFRALNHSKRQKLYELIFQKVQEASSYYPERSYHPSLNAEILNSRKQVTEHLRNAGFSGTYPLFQKEKTQILAMEEHPFTILEAQNFAFRIQFMVSETTAANPHLNAGFFKKRGNHSRIASSLDDL